MQNEFLAKLEVALGDTSGVYVNAGVDAATYFQELANDIRAHMCEPFEVTATVEPPGFPDAAVGGTLSGVVRCSQPSRLLARVPAGTRSFLLLLGRQHKPAWGAWRVW